MTNPLDLYYIRAAVESDLPQILDIFNERILNSICVFIYDPVPLENRATWFRETKAKGYPILVAVEKEFNKAVAYTGYGTFNPRTAYCLSAETTLYVHQEHQRRGLGSLLIKELLRVGKEMGLRCILASISADNEGSIVLFKKLGFKTVALLHDVGYKFGKFIDSTFLEYLTDAQVEERTIPSFKPFAWDTYEFGGTAI